MRGDDRLIIAAEWMGGNGRGSIACRVALRSDMQIKPTYAEVF